MLKKKSCLGIQKGTKSFAKATAMETIKLGTKLAVGTQVFLEHADEILSGEQTLGGTDQNVSTSNSLAAGPSSRSKFAEQPKNVSEGVGLAYTSLSKNMNTAAKTVLAVPMEVYEKTGVNVSP